MCWPIGSKVIVPDLADEQVLIVINEIDKYIAKKLKVEDINSDDTSWIESQEIDIHDLLMYHSINKSDNSFSRTNTNRQQKENKMCFRDDNDDNNTYINNMNNRFFLNRQHNTYIE